MRNFKSDTIREYLSNTDITDANLGSRATQALDRIEYALKLNIVVNSLTRGIVETEDGKKYDVAETFSVRGTVVGWNKGSSPENSIEEFMQKFDDPSKLTIHNTPIGQSIVHIDDLDYIKYRESAVKEIAKEHGYEDEFDPRLLNIVPMVVRVRAEAQERAEAKFGPAKCRGRRSVGHERAKK